jgi:hypothetical protein
LSADDHPRHSDWQVEGEASRSGKPPLGIIIIILLILLLTGNLTF